MNAHFERSNVQRRDPPDVAYGKVDHMEPGVLPGDPWLVAFDAIDEKWLVDAGKSDPKFDLNNPQAMDGGWKDYWAQVRGGAAPVNPLALARLFRIEVVLPLDALAPDQTRHPLSPTDLMERLEPLWFRLESLREGFGGVAALYYSSAFSVPAPSFVSISSAQPVRALALDRFVRLDDFSVVDTSTLETEFGKIDADFLAAYDVGQGNANGLLAPSTYARRQSTALYYDLGCGVYRNSSTTPSPLDFCFKLAPPVVLSHWDSDHWMGACLPGASGSGPGLSLDWVAPYQSITTHHLTFALDVLAHGGTFRIYNPSAGTVGSATTASGNRIKFVLGSGGGRNHSGIVLAVERKTKNGWRSWLLTGDCDYGYFLKTLAPAPVVGVVVPHHGAAPVTMQAPPVPAGQYCRVVYSFGSGNLHGKVQHPTAASVLQHVHASWSHLTWTGVPSPGSVLPGGDALATCEHPPGSFRGGALLGWEKAPTPLRLPCAGGCSALPTQV